MQSLKTPGYSIVYQEIPDETSLMILLSGCTFNCPGCHSPHLKQDIGEPLDEALPRLINDYKSYITTVLFMGGEHNQEALISAAMLVRPEGLKTAWYCGADIEPPAKMIDVFDYIKVGSYKEELGGLATKTTNQRLYKIENNELKDITYKFWK